MTKLLKAVPSLFLFAVILLIFKAEPPLSARAQVSGGNICETYLPKQNYTPPPPGQTHVMAYLSPDCPVQGWSVETEPAAVSTSYGVQLRWVDQKSGLPRQDTYPMDNNGGLLQANSPGTMGGSRANPVCLDDALLRDPLTWTLGLTVEMPPGRDVGLDPTPPPQIPLSRDLISGDYLPGVLAFTTTGSPTTTMAPKARLLSQQLIIDAPTGNVTTTMELIWEVETVMTTSFLKALAIETAVASKTVSGNDSLQMTLVDPNGKIAPAPGPGSATTTINTFGLTMKSETVLPSFIPALPLTPTTYLKAGYKYWLIIKVDGQWSLGINSNQGGSLPGQRLWRRNFDGTIDELQADLAFQLVGTATTTSPSAVENFPGQDMALNIAPAPFRGRTRISFAGRGDRADIRIYDLRGRSVRTLHIPMNGSQGELFWDGRNDSGRRLGAGTYLVRVRTNSGQVSSRKVTLLR